MRRALVVLLIALFGCKDEPDRKWTSSMVLIVATDMGNGVTCYSSGSGLSCLKLEQATR